jgi:putative nucleotidyltransferase with HDIG domain
MNLDNIIAQVKRLPPNPQIMLKLLRLLQDINTNPNDIVELIRIDAPLTAQVLRLSNSAYYGVVTPSFNLEEAINRVGFRETYKLVGVVCSSQIFNTPVQTYYLENDQLWENSIATALVMECIAQRIGSDPSHAYTIGLLHSIGKVIMNQVMADKYAEVYALLEKDKLSVMEAETQVLGFNYSQLGMALLKKWNFPPEIYEPIEYHFNPMEAPTQQLHACALHLATCVVGGVGLNYGRDAWAIKAHEEALQKLGLQFEDVERFLLQIHERLNDIKALLMTGKQKS